MSQRIPSLVQVSDETHHTDGAQFVCDAASGLLHIPGDPVPAIERMLWNHGESPSDTGCLQTMMTKADGDQPDPDVVRAQRVVRIVELQTDLQRATPDPDVIRATWSRVGSVRTTPE